MNETLFRQIRNHLYGSRSADASTDGLITELKKACTTKYKNSPERISKKDKEITYLYLLYKKKHEEQNGTTTDFSDETLDSEILLTVTAPVIRFFYNLLLGKESPTDPEPTTKVDGMKVEDIAHFFTNYMSPSSNSMSAQNCHDQIRKDLIRLGIGHGLHPNTYSLISAVAVEGKKLGLLVADQPTNVILRFAQLVEAAKTLRKKGFNASTLPQETQADLIVLLTEFTHDEEIINVKIADQGERLTSEQLIETLRIHADVNSLIELISTTFSPKESGKQGKLETATSTEVDQANASHIDSNKDIQSMIEGHKEDIVYAFKPFLAYVMTPDISIEEGILSLRTNFGQVLRTPSLGWDIRLILYKRVQEIINGPKCKENALDTFKEITALMILAGQAVRHTQKPATIASIRDYCKTLDSSKNPGDIGAVIRETISTVPEINYACPADQTDEYRKEYETAIDMLSDYSDEGEAPVPVTCPSLFTRGTELYDKLRRQVKEAKIQSTVYGMITGQPRLKAKETSEEAKARALLQAKEATEKRLLIKGALEHLWPSAVTCDTTTGSFPFCLELKEINDAEKEAKAAEKAEAEAEAKAAATKIQGVARGMIARQHAQGLKAEAKAATKIQGVARGMIARQHAQRLKAAAEKAEAARRAAAEVVAQALAQAQAQALAVTAAKKAEAATKIQGVVRGFTARRQAAAEKAEAARHAAATEVVTKALALAATKVATDVATKAATRAEAESATREVAEKATRAEAAADSPLRSKTISGETALPFLSLLAGAWCELPLISISASKVLFPLHAMKALDQTTPFMAAHLTATTLTGLLGAGFIYIALSAAISSRSPEYARAMKRMGRAVVLAGIIAGISSLVLALSAAAAATTAPTIGAAAAVAILAGLISASIASWQEQRHGEGNSENSRLPTAQAGTTVH